MAPDTPGRLLAISDLHVSHRKNRAALDGLPAHPDDWLIVAGDVGEKPEHLVAALDGFRAGTRQTTVMDRIAKGFTDEEIQAIAAWYATQR